MLRIRDCMARSVRNAQQVSPRVVIIPRGYRSRPVRYGGDIVLEIPQIVIIRPVIPQPEGLAIIVVIEQEALAVVPYFSCQDVSVINIFCYGRLLVRIGRRSADAQSVAVLLV